MTPLEWSLVISGVATGVAVASYIRVLLQDLPTVEFLVTRASNGEEEFWLTVSNPSRRLIILDWVEIASPPPNKSDTAVIEVMTKTDWCEGDIVRALKEHEPREKLGPRRMKPVFLAVPAGETRLLNIRFGGIEEDDEGGFKVDLRFEWSKGPWWTYLIRGTRRITLDADQVKARKMASFNHPSVRSEL